MVLIIVEDFSRYQDTVNTEVVSVLSTGSVGMERPIQDQN